MLVSSMQQKSVHQLIMEVYYKSYLFTNINLTLHLHLHLPSAHAMQLHHLCFILPADLDEREKFSHSKNPSSTTKTSPSHRHFQILAAIRRLLRRRKSLSVKARLRLRTSDPPQTSERQEPRALGLPIRRLLRCVWNQRWIGVCLRNRIDRQCSSGFQDVLGVELSEKVCSNNPRMFSYTELYIGSNGFSEDEVLGSGGFGRVYKAVLPSDGTKVAVKCVAEKGESFEKTFVAELMAVASLRHRNLVRLRGWCIHDDQLLLVYEYMPNRSLDHKLFRRAGALGKEVLDWKRRLRIISGLAAALFYLHEQLETQIIHRDVKTSNVMLDTNFNARLGDFGLARWIEHEVQFCSPTASGKKNRFRLEETSRVGGTIGYLPPESFQKRGNTTAKSDVFSFGIVALEVASGRRAVDLTYPDEQIILLDWVRWLSDEDNHLQAGDSRLPEGSYKLSDMKHLIHLGLLCSLNDPQVRPTMKWVVDALSGNIIGDFPALPSFNSYPYYISLSSLTATTTTNSTITSKNTPTTTTVSSTASSYVTTTMDTMFVTADNWNTNGTISNSRKRPITLHSLNTPQEIPYKELITATNNFSESRRVAEVDFGTAYHGYLNNRQHILVKRLAMKTCPALRARFSDELRNLKQLRHRNLVQLRGWCTEQGEMLVVYDYSASHLLSHLLFHHQEKRQPVLQWHHRYKIIKSLASAINYLHEEWDDQVIHRNITSSVIVLDSNMNPRLGCFALAEFLTRNEHGDHIVVNPKSSVRGIFGYMSPEYMEKGEATPAADIYSFGVVMLEVVSGRMAVDFQCPGVLLLKKVREFETRKRPLLGLVDRRLNGEYNPKELQRLMSLGMACTRSDPDLRPTMRQIVSTLDGNDKWLKQAQEKERSEEWHRRNASSLSLIRRVQALGIQ